MPAGALHRVGERLRHPPAPADQHQLGRWQRVGQVGQERGDLVGLEPADAATDDDPAVGEERRGLRGVDELADFVVVTVQVVDHERAVAVADQAVDELTRRGGQE